MSGIKFSNNGQWSQITQPQSLEDFAKSYVLKYNDELIKSTEVSLFRRMEDKYILPKSLKSDLEKLLNKHLKADYPDPKTKYNFMKSVYFDSSNLDMIRQHQAKADTRFKIRTREYAPNGHLSKSDFMYLEVKGKHNGISDKFRIKLPCEDVEGLKKGLPIIPSVKMVKANPHIGMVDLVKRITDINAAIQNFNMRPSCEISYMRKAFSDGAEFRVTFDEGMRYNVLDVVPTYLSNELVKEDTSAALMGMVDGYNPEHHIVLEVKHQGVVPDYMTRFLNDHKIVQTNFSKYCYSMTKAISGK